LVAYAACIAALSPIDATPAHAIQCQAAPPSNAPKHWTYRLIDGRKCWYEGKAMISKSLLQWPAAAPAAATAGEGPKRAATEKPADPMDSQAWVPNDSESFEARWRARAIDK
jgi:hypothetical protein